MPPVAAQALRGMSRQRSSPVFSSYAQALEASVTSYEDDELADVITSKTETFAASLRSTRQLDLSASRTLVGLAATWSTGRSLTVLDFGGQAGFHYFIARAVLPSDILLDWRVVETRAMVAAAARLETRELSFFDSISAAVTKDTYGIPPDLVFASGVLHCIPEPLRALHELVSVQAPTIYITRTGLSPDSRTRSIVHSSTLSDNGPGPLPRGVQDRHVSYPAVFVPRHEVETVLASRYNLVARMVEDAIAYRAGATPISMYGFIGRLAAR